MSTASDVWVESHYLSLTLWDIDLQFQKSREAYEQCLALGKRRRQMRWECFSFRKTGEEDALQSVLRFGRRMQELMEKGIEAFGARFERGDSICNATLAAQLLRVQQEIHLPLLDCTSSRTFPISLPRDSILTTAKSVRRTCLHALRDQYARLQSPTNLPFLPPPRFSVDFCPFALQIQKQQSPKFSAKRVRPQDRHDERELCPHCAIEIPVAVHSGLPQYRYLLFKAHLASSPRVPERKASFACTGCYKTFEDPYGFLDHVYQREIGSERSCQKRWRIALNLSSAAMESDPMLVEKCLRNCLRREMTRAKAMKKIKEIGQGQGIIKRDSVLSPR